MYVYVRVCVCVCVGTNVARTDDDEESSMVAAREVQSTRWRCTVTGHVYDVQQSMD